ncbi:helix-hairpin-helix domain-containing protein (plasmid) [Streptomyces sp. SDT5-1]|uniref:helix-hairpin-helix domain-containing protein n=1 Tax=Streptomyces sp. SDT5-1 TaxID=3406418 RepID=UPI003FCFE36A
MNAEQAMTEPYADMWGSSEPPPRKKRPPNPRRTSLERNWACLAKDNACAEHDTALKDGLGHDDEGHRIARRLIASGVTTPAQLRTLSPADILDVRGLGNSALKRITQQGLLGEQFQTRPGRRTLIHFGHQKARLDLGEAQRLTALIDFARDQDWDVVAMSVNSGAPGAGQWRKACEELASGTLDHVVYWDKEAGQPAALHAADDA